MCGIAGAWSEQQPPSQQELERMALRLQHRGPDHQGVWRDAEAGIGLVHRRLAIIDLSPAGEQPMASAGGRYVLVYNGEIYNHAELRRALEQAGAAPAWRGHSDTEILLAGFEHWGIRETLVRSNGMFAIAVWDRQDRALTLARDRLGEKPLYFGWRDGRFAFASETKSIQSLTGSAPRIDPAVAAAYLRTGYVGGPQSAIAGLFRLPQGSLLRLDRALLRQPRGWPELEARLDRYWALPDVVQRARAGAPPANAPAQLERLLQDAVALRMVADVPVGALLSGGVDSTTIVALMQASSSRRIRTFTAGFEAGAKNEAPHAAAVARHLGTEHTELYVSSQDALALIPRLPDIYDEPFADSSQIPTTLVARLARQHVKVALTGDGGDELFAGYHSYANARLIWGAIGRWPLAARRALAAALRAAAAAGAPLDGLFGGRDALSFRLRRLAWRLSAATIDEFRHALTAAPPLDQYATPPPPPAAHATPPAWLGDLLDRLQYADQVDYLPDDILVKVDRASMCWALETRIPLLDHRLVEFAWSLPRELMFDARGGKPLLKQLLAKHVPPALTDRPKQGFEVPLAAWLRGPLRDWAEPLLEPRRLQALGVVDADAVQRAWQRHLSGRANTAPLLWNVLMLAAWCERTGASA